MANITAAQFDSFMAGRAAAAAGGDAGNNAGNNSAPANNRQNNRTNNRATQAGQNKVEQYKDLQDASKIAGYGNDDKGRGRNSYARQAIADERSAKTGISQSDANNILYNFYSGNSNLSMQDVQSMSQRQAIFDVGRRDPAAASVLAARAEGKSTGEILASMQEQYNKAVEAKNLLSEQLNSLNRDLQYDPFSDANIGYGAKKTDLDQRIKDADAKIANYGSMLERLTEMDNDDRAAERVNTSIQRNAQINGNPLLRYGNGYDTINGHLASVDANLSDTSGYGTDYLTAYNYIVEQMAALQKQYEELDSKQQLADKAGINNYLSGDLSTIASTHEDAGDAKQIMEQINQQLKELDAERRYALSMMGNDPNAKQLIAAGKNAVEQDIAGRLSASRAAAAGNAQLTADVLGGYQSGDLSAGGLDERQAQGVAIRDDYSYMLPTEEWSDEQREKFYQIAGSNLENLDNAYNYAISVNQAYNAEKEKASNAKTAELANGSLSKKAEAAYQDAYEKYIGGYGSGDAADQGANTGRSTGLDLDVFGAAGSVALSPVHIASWVDKLEKSALRGGNEMGRGDNQWVTDQMNAFVGSRAQALNEQYGTIGGDGFLAGKGFGDLYQLSISSAQSLVLGNVVGEGATLALFFGQAADSSYDEAIHNGASAEQAAIISFMNGCAEVLGEKVSLEALLNPNVNVSTFSKFLKQLFKQGFTEASEEAFTDVLNLFGDGIAAKLTGQQAMVARERQQLIASGMSYEEAEKQLAKDFLHEVVNDALGGFLSGFGSSAVQITPAYISTRSAQNTQRAQQYKDTELINQNRAAIENSDFSGIFNTQLFELAKAADRQGDTATFEKIITEFTARAQKGELNDLGLNLDFGADTQRLANALREQLEAAAIQEAREGYVDSSEYDEAGRPVPEEEEQAPVPADSEEGYRNQNEIFEQMQARADEAAIAQQRAQALSRQQEEQNRQALQQQADAETSESFNRRLADTTPYAVEDVISRTTAKTTAEYVAAFREAIQQNPQLVDQILDARASMYGGRSALGRAIKQLQTELSTNATGTGTIEASNTQEVANGQSAVQEPAAGAGESNNTGRESDDRQLHGGHLEDALGARANNAESRQRRKQKLRDLQADELPTFVTEEDRKHLTPAADTAEVKAGTKLGGDAYATEGTQVIIQPAIGSRANLAQNLANALGLRGKCFLLENLATDMPFSSGAVGFCADGNIYIAVTHKASNVRNANPVKTVIHESTHWKIIELSANGGQITSDAFAAAFGEEAGSKKLEDLRKLILEDYGYQKAYDEYEAQDREAITRRLTENKELREAFFKEHGLSSLEEAVDFAYKENIFRRSAEEVLCKLFSFDRQFIESAGLSFAEHIKIWQELYNSLQANGVYTGTELGEIEKALDYLNYDNRFTDEIDFSDYTASTTESSVQNPTHTENNFIRNGTTGPDLNRAVRQAASGNVKGLSTQELRDVLNYALDRVSPETKGGPLLDRATDLLLEHADDVGRNAQPANWSSDTGYRGNSAGSLDVGQSERLVDTVSAVLNELDKRGVSVDEKAEGTVSRYANRFGIDEIENQPSNRSRSEMTIQERHAETDNGPTEFQQEEAYRKGKMRQDLEALRITAETEEKGKPLGRNGNYVKEAIPTKPGQNGWISNLEQDEISAEEAEEMFFKSQELEDDIDDLNRQIKEAEDRGDMGALTGLYKKLGSLTKQLNTISKRMTSSAMARTSFRNEMRRELQRERLQETRKPKAADMRPGAGNRTDFLSETGWPQSVVDREKALNRVFRSSFTDYSLAESDILSGETYTAAEGEQTQQRAKPAPDGVSALRQSMEKILNGEGDLFRAETEADQAPAHDDTDDPRHKLTKEERKAQGQRVGESPSGVKPVSADVVQGMLHIQESVKGILDSNRPVRHVMNLANSITDFSAEDSEMNWLATKEIKQTADDLKAIFEDGHIENDQKAQMMAEATVKLMNQVAARTARAEMFRKLGFEFTEHANKNGTGNMDAKGLKAFNQWAKSMQLNPTTAFKMVDGFDAGGNGIGYQIARQIQDSVALEQMLTASVHGQYHKLAGMEGLQDFVEGKSKSPVVIPGVGTITEQQAVEFIKSIRTLANQKVGNKSRLETVTGFTFLDKNGNRTEVKKSSFKSSKESSFFEDMRRLENEMLTKLSPAARRYLEITDDILFDLGKRVSKTKQQVTGVGFADFHKGDYYPVKYGRAEHTTDYTGTGEQSGIFDPFTDRTRKIGGYVEIGSAADTVDSYIQRSVYATAYGDLSDELQFLNSTALGMRGMTNSVGDAFGKSYARMFNNYANDVAGINTKDKSGAADLFKKGRLALQQGALRFSISVPIKQVASYWDAAGILSPEALVKAYRFKGAGAKGLGAENQLLAYRKVGNIDPTLSERLNDKGYVSELKKKSGVVRAFDLATNTMDYRTVDNLFTATIIDTQMAFPEMDVNSKQFKDVVAARFQDVVLQTQPVFNKNARSENQRTSNELIRMVSMFRTQQTQNYNRMVVALGEAKAAKGTNLEAAAKKQLKQTITGQVLASMEFGLLSIIADMARHKLKPYRKDDDDDRISAERILKRFALNSIESAAGTVWFGDQVSQAMIDIAMGDSSDSGGEFYGLNFGMLSSMGSALNGAVETAGTVAKAVRTGDWSKVSINNLRYAVTNAAQVFGIPANNIANLINSLAMYSLDAVDYATGHKSGNRGVYDNALKMFDDMLRGEYTTNTAKHQADKFFRTGDTENLLYNIALLEQDGREKAEKAGGDDPHKGHNYLANLLGTDETKAAEEAAYGRKLSANERIANYLVGSDLGAEAIDEAVNEYATSGGYNVFYNALRAQGMEPSAAVNEMYKSDNKTGMTTQIYGEDNVNLLLSGVDAPGDTYDVPPLEQRNLDEYVNYATSAKVFIETKNYDELDKLIDSYNDLDENTRAVLEAKDSNLIHLRECSDLGVGSAEYYGLKDTMKDVQVEMDKSTATGSPLKLIAIGRADLTDKQRAALLESDWMGISKTGKTVYTTLSKYGMSMEDVGQWLNSADFSWEDSNGTLSNIEVAQALRHTPGLTDSQRRAIYEELKPQLTNPHKINDWGRYTYDSEIAYIDKKGLSVGKWK